MKVHISEYMSYMKKDNVYAIYSNYNFYFLKDKAAMLFDKVLCGDYFNVPISFINKLIECNILEGEE